MRLWASGAHTTEIRPLVRESSTVPGEDWGEHPHIHSAASQIGALTNPRVGGPWTRTPKEIQFRNPPRGLSITVLLPLPGSPRTALGTGPQRAAAHSRKPDRKCQEIVYRLWSGSHHPRGFHLVDLTTIAFVLRHGSID